MIKPPIGSRRNPFERDPEIDEACLPRGHDDLVRELAAELETTPAMRIVVGEAGSGKSMVSGVLAAICAKRGRVARVRADADGLERVLRIVLDRLNAPGPHDAHENELTGALREVAASYRARNLHCAILIDDADLLTPESLAILHSVSDAHLVLFAQPDVLDHVSAFGNPKGREQMPLHELRRLSEDEAEAYLIDRLATAGRRYRRLFLPPALTLLARETPGLTGHLERIAAACLEEARKTGEHSIGVEVVRRVLDSRDVMTPRSEVLAQRDSTRESADRGAQNIEPIRPHERIRRRQID